MKGRVLDKKGGKIPGKYCLRQSMKNDEIVLTFQKEEWKGKLGSLRKQDNKDQEKQSKNENKDTTQWQGKKDATEREGRESNL